MIRRFAASTAAATGLALALTGCLGDAKEKAGGAGDAIKLTAAQVLGRSADKAGKVDSFTATMTTSMGNGQKMEMTMQTRLRPQLATKTTTKPMTIMGRTVPGFEMRMLGDTMYMKMPSLRAANGKPWTRMSLSKVGSQTGLNLDKMIEQSKGRGPAEQVRMFTASKNATKVGTETVGGVRTTHYKGTAPIDQALSQLDAENRKAMKGIYDGLGADTIAFDLWVDGDQLPRKITTSIQSQMGPLGATMVYRDYNKPVQISAPPASQVGAMPEVPMPGLGS